MRAQPRRSGRGAEDAARHREIACIARAHTPARISGRDVMMDDNDEQLTARLRTLAPPERDALFRIRVLERRERRQFINRVAALLGAGVVAVAAYTIASTVGGQNEVARGLGLAVA